MEDTIRKLASVQEITALNPIPNADMIEVADVLGWKVVVRKGQYNVGDLCVYIEIDSLIPKDILQEAGLWDEAKGKGKLSGSDGNRLKTIKLRKQVSQGLILPYSILSEGQDIPFDQDRIGENVTELLGIVKYEPPIPAQLMGQVKGTFPSFMKKTDSHRLQAYPRLIDEMQGVPCYASIKVDGTSSTFYLTDEFGVCSRNMDLKDTEGNTYWTMARKYDIHEKLTRLGWLTDTKQWAIQAETYGEGIQKNLLGVKGHNIAVFDIFSIDKYEYVGYDKLKTWTEQLGLPMVDIVFEGVFEWKNVEELVDFAAEQKYPNGSNAEGIVIRPIEETYSDVLSGRMAFKVISPKFLLKND